jgi:hypothetical protein
MCGCSYIIFILQFRIPTAWRYLLYAAETRSFFGITIIEVKYRRITFLLLRIIQTQQGRHTLRLDLNNFLCITVWSTFNLHPSRKLQHFVPRCSYEHAKYARFQASATRQMRTALFWVITQRVVVIPYRRFGTGCPKPSVRNYHYSLRNNSEERRLQHMNYICACFSHYILR